MFEICKVNWKRVFQKAYRGLPVGTRPDKLRKLFAQHTGRDDMPEAYCLCSPILHVDSTTAPALLLHGNADEVVPFDQSLMFKKALEDAGVPVELYEASDAGHGFFNGEPFFTPTLTRLEEFLVGMFRT